MSYSEHEDFLEKDRAAHAIRHWLGVAGVPFNGMRALEIGGSGGMLAGILAHAASRVTCTDVVDWNGKYDGCFPKLLKEKFERNDRPFTYGNVEFVFGDAQELEYRNNLFDLVFSLNVFEHIPSPIAALREVIRVTRPGGMIYLSFDPVWTADSGSHFLHRLDGPWDQLLKTDTENAEAMARHGASPTEIQSFQNDMNRLPAAYYRDNFPEVIAQCGAEIIHQSSWSGTTDVAFAAHPNLSLAAAAIGAPSSDLLIRGFCFVIKKIRG